MAGPLELFSNFLFLGLFEASSKDGRKRM